MTGVVDVVGDARSDREGSPSWASGLSMGFGMASEDDDEEEDNDTNAVVDPPPSSSPGLQHIGKYTVKK